MYIRVTLFTINPPQNAVVGLQKFLSIFSHILQMYLELHLVGLS